MDCELRTIPGCPNSGPALELFRETLASAGKDVHCLTVREISSENEAQALHFHGSPSFIAEGRDLFPAETAPALSCRLYRTGHGMARLPSAASLCTALRAVGSDA
jgi:hypothetical protein